MGKIKHLDKVLDLFEKSPVVDFKSIERIVKAKKNTKQYTKQMIRNLLLKNKIHRITKGYYSKYDMPSLAVFCFKPGYLGLQDALSFHNLWEQETIPVIITTNKVRQGTRVILGTNILIRRLDKKYMFGFEPHKDENLYLPYSDIEKTFIDLIYFKENIGNDTLSAIEGQIDEKKLHNYLINYPEKFRQTVLNKLT